MFRRVEIPAFYVGALFREGRLVRMLEPGARWVRGEVVLVDVRRRRLDVQAAPVLTKDGVPLGLRPEIVFRVADPARAVTQVESYVWHLKNDARAAAYRSVSARSLAEIIAGHNRLELEIQDRLALEASAYGVRVEDVALHEVRIPRDIRRRMKRGEAILAGESGAVR